MAAKGRTDTMIRRLQKDARAIKRAVLKEVEKEKATVEKEKARKAAREKITKEEKVKAVVMLMENAQETRRRTESTVSEIDGVHRKKVIGHTTVMIGSKMHLGPHCHSSQTHGQNHIRCAASDRDDIVHQ